MHKTVSIAYDSDSVIISATTNLFSPFPKVTSHVTIYEYGPADVLLPLRCGQTACGALRGRSINNHPSKNNRLTGGSVIT